MKKLLALLVLCTCSVSAWTQTQFRSLSFAEAIAAAKRENKQVFVDFYTVWCGPCKRMAKEVFPLKHVGDFLNERFVCLKLDAEREGMELAQRCGVKAYPTFLVFDTSEKVLLEMKGAMQDDVFIEKIKRGLDPDQTPERLEERYNSGERNAALVAAYAKLLLGQEKMLAANRVANAYFESLNDQQRLSAENAFLFLNHTFDLNDVKSKFMVARRNEFDASVKAAVADRIKRLYYSKLASYYSGEMLRKFNEDDYARLKADFQTLGLDEEGQFAPVFDFIENRVKKDDRAFLAYCEQVYGTLKEPARSLLAVNLSRLIRTKDAEMLGAMSRFLRSRLPEMSPEAISACGRVLQEIESKGEE